MTHYERTNVLPAEPVDDKESVPLEENAIDEAAEALREVDVEAAGAQECTYDDSENLSAMSVDQLRALAASLKVPHLGQIIDRSQLIAAITERQ
ncbi:MAG TPA: hypothetical protein VHU84_08715 [Lacipirellulaceae bacterium]|jgi:hypothetical protein|nr:hypothetical protein [Lacipirellulaceae bacterium]